MIIVYIVSIVSIACFEKWSYSCAFPIIGKNTQTHRLIEDIANRYADEIRAFPNEPSRYHIKASCFWLVKLVKKWKNFVSGGWTKLKLFICIDEVLQIVITTWSANVASKFWTDGGKMIIKFIRQHSWICYRYTIHFQRRNQFLSRFSRSKFIDSLPSLSGIDFVFVKTIMIIGLLC